VPRLFQLLLLVTAAAVVRSPANGAPTPPGLNPRYTGSPFITTWTAEDYGGAPINWHIAFNPVNGFVYVGNNYGVLEFDGAGWRLIELPNQGPVRAVAVDPRGRVWAGTAGDICLLVPDAAGTLRAVSMRSRLPLAQREVGTVVHAQTAPNGVFLANPATLYFFGTDGTVRTWPARPRISGLWWMDAALHVVMSDGAVFRLRGGDLVPVEMGSPAGLRPSLVQKRSFAARSEAGGADPSLLLTGYGPAHWAGPGAPLVPLSAESAAPFGQEQTICAAFLADGRIVYGMVRSGLLIFDRQGRILQHLTREDGLPGNRIEHIAEDREGGLWLAMHTGLARVQLDSPFAVHGLAQGLDGSPRDLLRAGDRLYLTDSEGAAWRGPDGRFHDFTGVRQGMNKLAVLDGRVLATGGSLRELRADGQAPRLLVRDCSPLLRWPQDPRRLIAGGIDGLLLLHWEPDGTARLDGVVRHSPPSIRELVTGADGWVWGTTEDGRIWRVDFHSGLSLDAPIEIFDEARGLPPVRHRDDPEILRLDGQILAVSASWMRRFDPSAGRFVPETRAAQSPFAAGATDAVMDGPGSFWIRLPLPDATFLRVSAAAGPTWPYAAVPSAPLGALVANKVYPDPALNTLWISGQGALVSLDLNWRPTAPPPLLRAYVRRAAAGATVLPRQEGPVVRLSAAQNSLRFDYAAPSFAADYRGKLLTVYRTRLDGLETDWTPWSQDTHREFSRLPFRQLRFRVQARSLDGRLSDVAAPESAFAFLIAPPWWLTSWAVAGYVGLLALVIALAVRIRTRQLRLSTLRLENTVAERTHELSDRNQELARLNRLELDEKISARLAEQRARIAEEQARLEALRYQLNPHFLFNALNSIRSSVFQKASGAGDMVSRLAEFCRTTLTRTELEGGTLGDELRMLQLYLEIEKARWEDALTVGFECDPEAMELPLPPFLLLPLVENAIKYGSRTSPERIEIRIGAKLEAGDRLVITVYNSGTWVAPTAAPSADSTGVGLANLRQRLAKSYPNAHELTVESGDGGVRVTLKLTGPAHISGAES